MTPGQFQSCHLNGILDDIRIYGKKLTSDEIRDLMDYNPISSVSVAKETGFDVLVFPNPSEGLVSFRQDGSSGIEFIQVFDSMGRIMHKGKYRDVLDLSHVWSPVVYIEFLDQNGAVITRKEVILTEK